MAATSRAEEVAELLWELKRAEKLASYTVIAAQAGFSAGANGRAMQTALKTVRRDWPHLQWWRAVSDTLCVEKGSEQAELLVGAGIELIAAEGSDEQVTLVDAESHLMSWDDDAEDAGEE